MTVRQRQRAGATPEKVAERLREPALELVPRRLLMDPPECPESGIPDAAAGSAHPDDLRVYAEFFEELSEQVTYLAGDAGMTMRVAELIGVSPADWYRDQVARWGPG